MRNNTQVGQKGQGMKVIKNWKTNSSQSSAVQKKAKFLAKIIQIYVEFTILFSVLELYKTKYKITYIID